MFIRRSGFNRASRIIAAVLVLIAVTARNAFACLDTCKTKFGYITEMDGQFAILQYCTERFTDTGTAITCYYKKTGVPVNIN